MKTAAKSLPAVRSTAAGAEDAARCQRLEDGFRAASEILGAQTEVLRTANANLSQTVRTLRKRERELRVLVGMDALTGLLNRRGFAREFRRLQKLVEREHGTMGLLMLDLDHFRQVNDHQGHDGGDRVLEACAQLLRAALRSSDIVCRYGGDEFMVALPMANGEKTRLAAERLLHAVRNRRFGLEHLRRPVTVSIGAACSVAAQPIVLETLMLHADHALYRSKRAGRNRVTLRSGSAVPDSQLLANEDPTCGDATLESLVAMLDARERTTGEHSKRVARMACILARSLQVAEDQIAVIRQGALLHDIGKIAIPDSILLKPGPLTADERTIMQNHPDIGFRILHFSPTLAQAAEIVLSHQERHDGSGYPRGLKGDEICLGARIFAVVDAYDAICAGRPYAPARTPEQAIQEILRCAGTHYDPVVVAALVACQRDFESAA